MKMSNREIEFKWQFQKERDVARLISTILSEKFAISVPKSVFIRDQYLDTQGHELARKGVRLRIRKVKDQVTITMKGQSFYRDGLAIRRERNIKARNMSAAGLRKFMADRLKGIVKSPARFTALFLIKNRRQIYLLSKKRFRLELCVDRVLISQGKRSTELREIELELVSGSSRDFLKLVKRLTTKSGLRPAKISKVATACRHFKLPHFRSARITARERKSIFG